MSYVLKTNYAHKSNYGSYRDPSKIKYIVFHYTANDGDTDEANARYFKTPNLKTSAHYFVDDDSVTISVPDTYTAYSVGGKRYSDYKTTGGAKFYKTAKNENTINIELCDTIKNGKHDVSPQTLENAIQLTKELMKKYNIPIENVIRHFDVTGKSCPAYLTDQGKWDQIKHKISDSYSGGKGFIFENLDYSPVFDPVYYAERYPDLKAAFGEDAASLFRHFYTSGMKEGRVASANFDVNKYKEHYADLRSAFGDNLPLYYKHYLTHGYDEHRKAV